MMTDLYLKTFMIDYNNEGLDHSVRGLECKEFPERRDLKKLLDILRSK